MGDGNTNRITVGKPRVGMTSPEGGNSSGNIYTAPGGMEGSGAHLKCLYPSTRSVINKQNEMEALSAPRATTSLVLVSRGGMSPMVGVLEWRATGVQEG